MEICIICVLIENVTDLRIATDASLANIVKKERNIYILKQHTQKGEKNLCKYCIATRK